MGTAFPGEWPCEPSMLFFKEFDLWAYKEVSSWQQVIEWVVRDQAHGSCSSHQGHLDEKGRERNALGGFPNLSMQQNLLLGLLYHTLSDLTLIVSDSVGLGGAQEFAFLISLQVRCFFWSRDHTFRILI